MKFSDIQQLLDAAIGGGNIGAHQAFWRAITRDQFVVKKVFGRLVVNPGNAADSNLVRALRGEAPFGVDIGTPGATIARMPARRSPMAPEDIARISDWINAECPE